jgi:Protein of unknown function (DUF3606)
MADLSREQHINIGDPDEVQYWSDKLGVSKERLTETVRKVGDSVVAVQRELKPPLRSV